VDPATGSVRVVEGQHYVVSSTYGVPKPTSDGKLVSDRYLALFGAVAEQLEREPGLIALQLGQSNACGSGRTLAIWRSEEEMYDFVTSRAHLDAMTAADEILQPGYAVTHWDATSATQFSMQEAVRQLAKIEASP
jgi:heme-degrading monooxygenase HmoA